MKEELTKQIVDIIVESKPDELLEQVAEETWLLTRPINLEDILKVWGNMQTNQTLDYSLTVGGDYLTFENNAFGGRYDCYWRLGKPLHKQDEQTLKFILSILTYEN